MSHIKSNRRLGECMNQQRLDADELGDLQGS